MNHSHIAGAVLIVSLIGYSNAQARVTYARSRANGSVVTPANSALNPIAVFNLQVPMEHTYSTSTLIAHNASFPVKLENRFHFSYRDDLQRFLNRHRPQIERTLSGFPTEEQGLLRTIYFDAVTVRDAQHRLGKSNSATRETLTLVENRLLRAITGQPIAPRRRSLYEGFRLSRARRHRNAISKFLEERMNAKHSLAFDAFYDGHHSPKMSAAVETIKTTSRTLWNRVYESENALMLEWLLEQERIREGLQSKRTRVSQHLRWNPDDWLDANRFIYCKSCFENTIALHPEALESALNERDANGFPLITKSQATQVRAYHIAKTRHGLSTYQLRELLTGENKILRYLLGEPVTSGRRSVENDRLPYQKLGGNEQALAAILKKEAGFRFSQIFDLRHRQNLNLAKAAEKLGFEKSHAQEYLLMAENYLMMRFLLRERANVLTESTEAFGTPSAP